MNTISIVGAIASILGLGFTVGVFFRVKKIGKSFCTQAMLPTYRKKLGSTIKNLGEHQRNKNGPQIRIVLSRSRATLADLAEHLTRKRAERVNQSITFINTLLERQSDDVLWEESGSVIASLQEVQETVANLEEEMQWRVRDA